MRDFERALAPRGQRAAPLMGAFIAEHDLTPDLVVCSPAVRARETLDLVVGEFERPPEIQFIDDLYLAAPADIIGLLRGLAGSANRVMMVGHNPGIQALARILCQGGKEDSLAALAGKFPTAALAVIDFEAPWGEIGPGLGRLALFATPRALASTARP